MQPILTTHQLAIGYSAKHALASQLQLSLAAGEMVCLLGPNGVGKTTLLRTLTGLQAPLAGQVLLADADLHRLPPAERARRLSVVFTGALDPGLLTVYDLVALGRHPHTDWLGRLNADDHAAVRQALTAVGAIDLAARPVAQLSDGQRQKVLIARALAQSSQVLVLDEPTAFLDVPHRVETMRILRQLAHHQGRAVLLSTHDLDLALRHADQLWLMMPDSTIQVGAPEDLVLAGVFARAFAHHDLVFDPHTGSFALHTTPTAWVAVYGEGLPAVWTRRALERAGYTIALNGQANLVAIQVAVHTDAAGPTWQVTANGRPAYYDSLHALVNALAHQEPSLAKNGKLTAAAAPQTAAAHFARAEGD